MAVGAIRPDTPLSNAPEARGSTACKAQQPAIDFEALLIAAGASCTDPTFPGALPSSDVRGSATKTESSRSVSIVGGLRRTIITYTDGTSDMVSVGNDGVAAPQPTIFVGVPNPVHTTIKPNSDLEPETRIAESNAPSMMWRFRPHGRAATGVAAHAGRGKVPARLSDAETPAEIALRDIGRGGLVDMMV